MGVRLYWWQIGIASAITLYTNSTVAQITPDATLPNNSNVTLDGKTFNITGGSTAGSNLFHSFKDFSIPTGSSAFFNNPVRVQNIISRVTGKSISNIDGLIKANGAANLFLINPNGIIFGENARLDINGSFLATSANSMKFASGFEFSAVNSESKPLLTITVPVGLQFGASPGSIQVQGNGQGARKENSPIIDIQDALRVRPDKTLALVGGDINLEGATLKTAGGRIELGSVARNSSVSLTPNKFGFALGYDGVQNFGNIQLSQQATVDASGEGGGDIQVQGRQVTLTNDSQIETSTLGAKQGGDLVVNATESVQVSGQSGSLAAEAYPKATGNAGNLTINTRELLITGGAFVSANTSGAGKSGNLTVTASRIQVIGRSSDGRYGSTLSAQAGSRSTGDAGNLTINTGELLITGGAQVSAGTFGTGNGGNLTVIADSIQVLNRYNARFLSNLFTQANPGSTGNAGDLTINTRELLVTGGAQVSASTFGAGKGGNLDIQAQTVQVIGGYSNGRYASNVSTQSNGTGNAGDLKINTGELLIKDGALVSSGTLDAGKGGNLTVNASRVQVIGSSANGRYTSLLTAQATPGSTGNAGDLTINTGELLIQDGAEVDAGTFGTGKAGNLTVTASRVQVIGRVKDLGYASNLSAQSDGTGNAGNLTINTGELLIQDGASINAYTVDGKGKAGNIIVDANSIMLNNAAEINSDTKGGGGNIFLNSPLLLLRRGSSITTNASGDNITGGNININAKNGFIIALPSENSNIRADSANFRGGNVIIKNIAGIFGIQATNNPSGNISEITAKGATPDLSGNIQIPTPDVDPNKGLIELPINLVDASNQIYNACTPGNPKFNSTFTVTGRGGLPISPEDLLQDVDTLTNWITSSNSIGASGSQPIQAQQNKIANPIVEATSWKADSQGQVYLVANTPQFQHIPSQPNFCPAPLVA